MAIYEYQAKKLYVKKEDLEQSLGLKLTDIKTRIFETKKELPDYLKPYSLMPTFTLSESVALLLDINPNDYYQQNVEHYLYSSTEALLTREIDSGALNNYGGVSKENIKISHIELEKWAKNKGYKWNLPSYYSNNINQEQTNQTDQIAELQARIAELEAEKQNTKKAEPKKAVQEYDGDIQPQTDRDKLAKTFRLVIQQSKFIEMNNGRYPTYSQLHTMLNHIYPKEQIPSKNTLKKYLEP